jgi:hypothetical protein
MTPWLLAGVEGYMCFALQDVVFLAGLALRSLGNITLTWAMLCGLLGCKV